MTNTPKRIHTTYMHLCRRGMESDYMRRKPGSKYIPSTCVWCPFDDEGIKSDVLGFYIIDHRDDPWSMRYGSEGDATIVVYDGDDMSLRKVFNVYEEAVEFYNRLPSVIEHDWLLSHFSYD